MQENPICNVGLDQQIEIVSPIIEAIKQTITTQFSHSIKIDLSSSDWWLITDPRTRADFSKPHTLELLWEDFQAFFRKEKDLYIFLEKPILGIVHKKGTFWAFFEPKTAMSYFQRQEDRPKDFNKASIKRFPHIPLSKGLTNSIKSVIQDPDPRAMNNIKKVETILEMSDAYLPKEEASNLTKQIRKVLITLSLAEVRLLKTDITNPGVSPTMLEKRLLSIYKLCLRLYAVKNDEREQESLKKLLSPKIIIRRKALELVEQQLLKEV